MALIPAGGVGQASAFSDYATGGANEAQSSSEAVDNKYLSLEKLKKQYKSYIWSKTDEIEEQQDARRFRHASQWTSEQVTILEKRKQPLITINKIGPWINRVVGSIQRLRQDPKAYPRTPKQEQGADLATAVLKYVLDASMWKQKEAYWTECGAIDGLGCIELNLVQGDQGDPDIEIEPVNPDSFFYDPRSYKADFSDARYMGVGKWLDVEQAKTMYPDYADEIEASNGADIELTSSPDRDFRWFMSDGENRQIRFIEHWYQSGDKWLWALYTGSFKLTEGVSPLIDEKGKTFCKYFPYSAFVDQDGDRYGFIRDLKPIQSEINMRRSKALYTMLSRRIMAERGAFENVEDTRREAARPDGVVLYNKGFEMSFDDSARLAETEAQFKFLEDAKMDLDNLGPGLPLPADSMSQDASGRALAIRQQAGLDHLGPFLSNIKQAKIAVYRGIWNTVQRNWKAERWIRVTDQEDIAQFIQVNGVGLHPQTGMPTLVNALGQLDVDIVLDEGPDSINQMLDAYDTLTALARQGAQVPPDILIELAPLPLAVKRSLQEKMNNPMAQAKGQLQIQNAQAKIAETQSSAVLNKAQAFKAMHDAQAAQLPDEPVPQQMPEHPAKVFSDAAAQMASAEHKKAMADKVKMDTALELPRFIAEHQNAQMDRQHAVELAKMKPQAPPK